MTRIIAIAAALTATQAAAHTGHIADLAGHAHWELLGGLALIAVLGLPAVHALLRRR